MLEDRKAMMAAMAQGGTAKPPPDINPDKRETMLAMSEDIGPAEAGPEPPRPPTPSPSSDRDSG